MTQGKLLISNGINIKFCVLPAARKRKGMDFFFSTGSNTFILRGHLRLKKEKVG